MSFRLCSRNGTLIPIDQATVPITNIEFAYGFGVYENVRVVRGVAIFLCDHVERLLRSAQTIGLSHCLTPAVIKRWTTSLIADTPADALNIKMLLIGGRTPEEAVLYILPLAPHFPDKRLFRDGVQTITVEYERFLPDAKTLSMLGSYLMYRKAKEAGAFDALLVNRHGCITEGTRTNVFGMKGRTIISAPRGDILEGVTMKHVLSVARSIGLQIEERSISPTDLRTCDGAFLTSTSSKIMPIKSIDGSSLQLPEALRELMKAFEAYLDAHIAGVPLTESLA